MVKLYSIRKYNYKEMVFMENGKSWILELSYPAGAYVEDLALDENLYDPMKRAISIESVKKFLESLKEVKREDYSKELIQKCRLFRDRLADCVLRLQKREDSKKNRELIKFFNEAIDKINDYLHHFLVEFGPVQESSEEREYKRRRQYYFYPYKYPEYYKNKPKYVKKGLTGLALSDQAKEALSEFVISGKGNDSLAHFDIRGEPLSSILEYTEQKLKEDLKRLKQQNQELEKRKQELSKSKGYTMLDYFREKVLPKWLEHEKKRYE